MRIERFTWDHDAPLIFHDDVSDFNPNHEPGGSSIGGRFSSGSGGSEFISPNVKCDRVGSSIKAIDFNEHHAPAGSSAGGQFTSAEGEGSNYGLVPGDVAKYKELKSQWSKVNNSLLSVIDKPDGPEARSALDKMEAIAQEMHGLHADPGTPEGIGYPGGPRDVTIVGAGPGGLAASINGAAEGLDTLVIDANVVAGGQAKFSSRIENFPGFPIGVTGEHLTHDMFEQAQRLGAESKLGVRVTGMTYDATTGLKHLTLSDGQHIASRTVILAGGVEFRRMDFPGSEGPGVIVGDGKKLAEAGAGGGVAVVGGSNGAAQAALGCAQRSDHVYLLARSQIANSMSAYQIDALKNNPKIKVIEGDTIAKLIRDEHGNPQTLETSKGQHFSVRAVGQFLGSVPDTKWLSSTLTPAKDGKIETNANFETSIPGVYAIGDMREGAIGRVGVAVGEGQFSLRQANVFLDKQRKPKAAADSLMIDGDTVTSTLITRLFDIDRANPWFGQTVEGVKPPSHHRVKDFDENEERDYHGRWTVGGLGEGEKPINEVKLADIMTRTSGLKGVIPFMSPDELSILSNKNNKNIVDAANQIVKIFGGMHIEEMEASAFAGSEKKGWYKKSAQAIVDIFGVKDAPRFAALLAATSPRSPVESNAINTLNIWGAWIGAGRPQDEASIMKIAGSVVQGEKGEESILPAWQNNMVTALTTEAPEQIKLSGPKVDSFMRNLVGEVNAVTLDTWMANFEHIDQKNFIGSGKPPGKGGEYIGFSAGVRAAAEGLSKKTGETWTPSEIQETVWSFAKTLYEKAGTDKTARQLLEAGGMTHADVASTPDFAHLFTQGVYANILEKTGYAEQVKREAGIVASSPPVHGSNSIGRSVLSSKGSGFTKDAFTRHILAAADRLDALRAERVASKGTNKGKKAKDALPIFPHERQAILKQISSRALRGVCEHASKMVTRSFAHGVLSGHPASRIAFDIAAHIGKVARERGRLVADDVISTPFANASLDALAANGYTHVGTIAERLRLPHTRSRISADDTRSRISDRQVEVLTAGDDDVCQECDDISAGGPYEIEEARELIPAHGRCRCAFVPVPDHRFAKVKHARDFDPNEERDPHGMWTSGGSELNAKAKTQLPSFSVSPYEVAPDEVARRKGLAGEYTQIAKDTATKFGYNPDKVSVSVTDEHEFKLDGQSVKASGVTYERDNTIVLFPLNMIGDDPKEAIPEVLSHEVMHAKFNDVLRVVGEEVEQAYKDGYMMSDDGVIVKKNSSETAPPGKYPVYEKLGPLIDVMDKREELERTDGATPYSFEHWSAVIHGREPEMTAIHETLAEIGRLDYMESIGKPVPDDQKKPISVGWRQLFTTVNELYKKVPHNDRANRN